MFLECCSLVVFPHSANHGQGHVDSLLSAFPIWFVVTSCNLLDLLECRLTRATWFISRSPEGGCFGQLSRYTPFPTGAPALQTECYHIVEGCMVFCISVLVGCWLLAVGRGGSAFWYWGASLIPQLEVELEKYDGNFLHKKGVFSSCAVAVRVAPVVTIKLQTCNLSIYCTYER